MTDEFPVGPPSSSNGYDPDKVFNASRDSKGFGSSLRIKVPPSLLSELGKVVQSGAIPDYRTREDFFRDAIYHRLHWAIDKAPQLSAYALQFMAAVEADRLLALNEHRDQMVKMANQIADSVRRDEYRCESATPVIKGILDSLPPRSQWRADVESVYDNLLHHDHA